MKRKVKRKPGRPRKNPAFPAHSFKDHERVLAKHGELYRTVKAYMAEHGCSRNVAIEAVAGDPDKARNLWRQLRPLFEWEQQSAALRDPVSYDVMAPSLNLTEKLSDDLWFWRRRQ